MDATTIKCQDLMIGDWITNESGLPTQIITVSGACAYAIFGGDEGDPWVFDDYIYLPIPIPLTPEILEKNGIKNRDDKYIISGLDDVGQWYITLKDFKPQFDFWFIKSSNRNLNVRGQIRYVHEFQHALRLVGLTELANNFKI